MVTCTRRWLAAVVPTLDEGARIADTVHSLAADPAICAVVVADGGSTDDTAVRVQDVADEHPGVRIEILEAPRGRARQLNAGARHALKEGDVEVLIFVHADCGLPSGFGAEIARVMDEPDVIAGAFITWTVDDGGASRLGPLLHLADLRSRYSNLPYGDQAPFMRASAYERVGGYPDQPLMEDLEMSRRLRRLGRMTTIPRRVQVSGRRFVARPIFYTTLVNVFPALYRLGVSAETLARLYRHVR